MTSHTVNLIDTPGHADFTFEVLRSLRILDGAVCILDGVAGVEAQTEKVWHQANTYQIPRIIFINKMDRDGAAFGRTVREIRPRLLAWPAVCQIPWWENGEGRFVGVGDVIRLRALAWQEGGDGKSVQVHELDQLDTVDAPLAQEIRKARIALVELLSEHDEGMVENFLEHDEDHMAIPAHEIVESLRRCIRDGSGHIAPVLAGASFRNIGVQPLLDAIVDLLPEPDDRPDPDITVASTAGKLGDLMQGKMIVDGVPGEEKHKSKGSLATPTLATASPTRGLEGCALAFKVVNDPRRGVLVYVRVYSGTIKRNAVLFNTQLHLSERAPRLLRMYASDAAELSAIPAGQIGVITGLKYARTGDTLLAYSGGNAKVGPPWPLNTLQLRPIDVPPPVFFASVEPASLSEEKHLGDCLNLLLREDPSLQINVDEDSGQTLLSGMGELHLEIARDRLVNDFQAKAHMGRIEIGYRETISTTTGPVHVLFDREIAGRKGKAGCEASVAPMSTAKDTEKESPHQHAGTHTVARDGNLIAIQIPALLDPNHLPLPAQLPVSAIHRALVDGAQAALSSGPTFFYPLHDVAVTLGLDLSRDLHGAITTPAALTSAARQATRAALSSAAASAQGSSSLMEPVMRVQISVDEASLGSVVHDLSASRGGHVLSLSSSSAPSPDGSVGARPIAPIYAPPDPFESRSSRQTASVSVSVPAQRSITARVPLKEMIGYLKHLRSLSGGRGTFVMAVDRFERMSKQRERAVLAETRGL